MAAAKDFRAKTEIHITTENGKAATDKTPAKPPKVAIVPAGGILNIDPDSDTAKELLAMGSMVATDKEVGESPVKVATKKAPAKPAAKKAAPKKPAAKPAADEGGDGDGEDML